MSTAPEPPRLRKRIWRAFRIAWVVAFVGLNAWSALVWIRAYPFKKSYILGAEEVDERHELSWLVWGRYLLLLKETEEPSIDSTSGGDIAVELMNDAGDVIIPGYFLYREHHGRLGNDYRLNPGYGFEAETFERFTLRVTTKKDPDLPARRVEVEMIGDLVNYAPLLPIFTNVMIFMLFGVSAGILGLLNRICLGKEKPPELADPGE